jgi:hypothetical protein
LGRAALCFHDSCKDYSAAKSQRKRPTITAKRAGIGLRIFARNQGFRKEIASGEFHELSGPTVAPVGSSVSFKPNTQLRPIDLPAWEVVVSTAGLLIALPVRSKMINAAQPAIP